MIAQHNIDNLLCSIGVAASTLNRKVKDKDVGMIYHGLCRLFSTTLMTHRKKLGGRYHLIVRALQSLIRCLFLPYANVEATPSDMARSENDHPLDENHAAAYARLLTTLCDPTVSSVTHSKQSSRQELNDETKKARSIAGQHVQYLVGEYCECQLKGRLSPEMKAALNPGLYAVFAIMPQEVMRNLNAAMGSPNRAIFKTLYEDYKRLGQWNGT